MLDTSSPGNTNLEQRRIQEREQQQREQRERSVDVRLPSPAGAAAERLPDGETPCFPIRQIELRGQEAGRFGWLIDAVSGPQQTDSPLRKCLGAQGVGLVIRRAQDALVERGYITSRVLAQPQDLNNGHLSLTVLPGRIRAIRFEEPVSDRATAWNAFPASAGDILNLRDIEQALENFQRVPTAEADIQIVPADVPGQSDLLVRWRQGTPFRVHVGADDSGTQGTGKYQGNLTLSYDHWWTLNDLFYLSLQHDLGGGASGARGTRGATAHYSIPMGYWMLGMTASSSRYFQTVAGASQDYVYRGSNRNQEVSLSRLVHRDASSKTTLRLKAFARQSNNFIDDTEVEVQRRRVGGWELGVTHRAFVGPATIDAGLAYKRGTGAFGALPAPEEAFGEGSSRFALVSADIGLQWPLSIAGRRWQYNGQWRAQFNRTPLTPQDRFAIGGRYTVRGFDGASSLSAERGWLLRNELLTAVGPDGMFWFVALDTGQVGGPSAGSLLGRRLSGAVLGLRGSAGRVQYELFAGAPLKKPEGFRTAHVSYGFQLNAGF
ncbi:ShlB/FhaC/HecB family hemolysin secretion/activation protein [Hydrogenophaga sp.]|uniref:ShlB/FhaC/HecB family hemolysin secretion/activation protein n=1 Tax=Hydrogenophaga sp. TaxID=1904254 RepID=UPI003562A6BD